ncbi:MAG: hypothetical protein ACHREM_03485 [Polyangiales bacterium]
MSYDDWVRRVDATRLDSALFFYKSLYSDIVEGTAQSVYQLYSPSTSGFRVSGEGARELLLPGDVPPIPPGPELLRTYLSYFVRSGFLDAPVRRDEG